VDKPPKNVDAMLMEGSSLGCLDPDQKFPSEANLEEQFTADFKQPGFVAVCASAQNIDRIVSLYRACRRTGRTLVLDLYALEILRAAGNTNLPAPGWPNLALYVPEYQRRHVKRTQQFELLEHYKGCRIFGEALSRLGSRVVMLFRPAMLPDIDNLGLWSGARAIWSQWEGYLKDGSGAALKAALAARSVSLNVIHTSGHASIRDLKRLAMAINPAALVPIHTFEGNRFPEFFGNVAMKTDGTWWAV
jgi:ribonuclease J